MPSRVYKRTKEQRKKLGDSHRTYTSKVINLMRKLSKEKTSKEAIRIIELEIGKNLFHSTFKNIAYQQKILFLNPAHKRIEKIELFQNKKFKKFIEKHEEIDLYKLRDEIIEEFGVDIKLANLRIFCDRYKNG